MNCEMTIMSEGSPRLDDQLCFPLYACAKEVVRQYRKPLEKLNLTYTQYLVMMVLWEDDSQTVGEIGHRLMLDTNTLTPMLQRMEREGLVTRTRGTSDGRQTLVSLTPQGKRLEHKAKDIPSCMAQKWHGDTLAPDQLESMIATIDVLIAGMK